MNTNEKKELIKKHSPGSTLLKNPCLCLWRTDLCCRRATKGALLKPWSNQRKCRDAGYYYPDFCCSNTNGIRTF